MICKNTFFFIILASTFLPCVAMDPHMAPPVQRAYPLDFQPMKFVDDSDDEFSIDPHPITITDPILPTFEGIPVQDLETVFSAAPRSAQFIVEQLQDKILFDELDDPAAFLLGNHGSGKTVLAKTLAYKICSTSPWAYEYISSRAFMGKYRNQTGVRLHS